MNAEMTAQTRGTHAQGCTMVAPKSKKSMAFKPSSSMSTNRAKKIDPNRSMRLSVSSVLVGRKTIAPMMTSRQKGMAR